ncbi:MAG: hypothetical protein B1H11_11510 [Desulfobacteraceae bacterium 4484_190.1]|nr:MAG: hypothetical protein B1H11_11510 [Desulfobacteraceae bacterium 4484_190.1]
MNTPALLFGCGLAAVAVYLLRLAKQEMRNQKLAKGLTQTRIRDVQPGLCLVEGVVESREPLSTPYTQTPSIWYRYEASERRRRKKQAGMYEHQLASGTQSCPFILKDKTGSISIASQGGQIISYPHKRILKSESGQHTGIGDHMKKMKEMWVQPGDRVFILGTASMDSGGSNLRIGKVDKSPLFLSYQPEDLTAKSFQKSFYTGLLVGAGCAIVALFLILLGFEVF